MTWSQAFRAYITKRFGEEAQKQASLSLGIAPSSVSYWCRGCIPREETRNRIARWSKGEVPAELHVARGRHAST